MSETYVLKAEARERVGKGSARAIRRDGKIPAVIYGDNQSPLSITLPLKEVTMKIHDGGFMTTVADIELDGTKHHVLPKAYELHPVKDTVMHVDFLRVSAKTDVVVEIPVHFINEETCPGLKKGGVLNIVRHEVEVHCPAGSIPEYFTVDLSGFGLGDAIKISSVDLPAKVTPTITDRDFTIATIAAPAGLKSESGGEGEDDGQAEAEVEAGEE